jgi:hypothetical protein
MEITSATEGLQGQRDLVAKLEADGGWDIIVGDAFVRGMRDIGYKSTAYAMAELVDNAVEASAQHIDIVFGFEGASEKPTSIAVIDDGYGMEPKMVRAALIWGAGTRAAKRDGYGKYGYGLPSASVSQCQRITIYSKTSGGSWTSCYLDIDEISNGTWTKGSRLEMPNEKAEEPPAFAIKFLKQEKRWAEFDHGTVVVWEKLDRVEYKQRAKLRDHLVADLGVVYRNVLVATPMTVDGVKVLPCDPLFLTPGFRGYDIDEDRAIPLEPAIVAVKDKETGKEVGHLKVRFSRLPATFFRKPEAKHTNKPGRGMTNERLEIADAYPGIIFCRNGRQIDYLRPPRSFTSINATTDRFWGIEVDFEATLDEMFSITTAKQQVRPEERIWDILKDSASLLINISTMRSAYEKDARSVAVRAEEDKAQKRASIAAIEAAEKFRTTKPPKDSPKRSEEAETNLDQEARRRAQKAGVAPEAVKREIVAHQEGKTKAVETEDLPGGAFFRCAQLGGQRVLYLNVAHPFYSELYGGPGSTPRLRASLEILLWALGEAEVDADPESDKRQFYELERPQVWSPYVAAALTQLKSQPLVEAQGGQVDQTDEKEASAA